MYLLLKYSHLALAFVSVSGFVIRGYWMLKSSPRLGARLTRIAPHVVDTLFLLSGVALVLRLDLPVTKSPWLLAKFGAKHRKRSGQQPSEGEAGGSGAAIAVGALIDGIPESIAIGLTMLAGGGVSMAAVVAIFISNIPEGLSSSAGMKAAGRSKAFVFGLWFAIALVSGIAALAGYSVFAELSPAIQAATTALAAGGILAMLSETMIPEAFEGTHDWAGIITCVGFLCAFALSMLGA